MEEPRQEADRPEIGLEQSATLHRASKLVGKEVKNTEGKELGSIYDLVLTADHEQVSYAVLSRGGWWGIGSKLFAIPWQAFKVGPEAEVTLAVSEDHFEDAESFNSNNWPAEGNTKWLSVRATTRPSTGQPGSGIVAGEQNRDLGTGRPGTPSWLPPERNQDRETTAERDPALDRNMDTDRERDVAREEMPSAAEPTMDTDARRTAAHREVQNRRVTNLTGLSVMNDADEDIGNVEDFVIDTREGRIAYTIVSFGGFWGIGEKYAAVPSSAISLEPRQDVARLDADRQTLESVAFASGDWPNLSDRSYAQRLHETFDAEPYWTVFGYVSPEEQRAASERAWGPESEYGRNFNAENMTTVTGTVQSIGAFHPEGAAAGVADGIRLRLTTEDGNLVTVHAGPQSYFERHRFSVKPGDKVTVTGSNTKIGWRSVLIATQIKAENRTLELRTETGAPLWNQQPGPEPDTTRPSPRPGEPAGSPLPSMDDTSR